MASLSQPLFDALTNLESSDKFYVGETINNGSALLGKRLTDVAFWLARSGLKNSNNNYVIEVRDKDFKSKHVFGRELVRNLTDNLEQPEKEWFSKAMPQGMELEVGDSIGVYFRGGGGNDALWVGYSSGNTFPNAYFNRRDIFDNWVPTNNFDLAFDTQFIGDVITPPVVTPPVVTPPVVTPPVVTPPVVTPPVVTPEPPQIDDSINTGMVTQQVINFNIINGRAVGSIKFVATNSFNPYYYNKDIINLVQFKTPNGVTLLVKQNRLRFTQTERDEIIHYDESVQENTRVTVESFVWEWMDKPAGSFSKPYTIDISEKEPPKPTQAGFMGAGALGAIAGLIVIGMIADYKRG